VHELAGERRPLLVPAVPVAGVIWDARLINGGLTSTLWMKASCRSNLRPDDVVVHRAFDCFGG